MERPPLKLEKFREQQMRRSKLETYIEILKVLTHNGPLEQSNIMSKTTFNCNLLKEHLSFLTDIDLIEKRTINKRKAIFAVTQRGITILKYFRELEQVPSIIE